MTAFAIPITLGAVWPRTAVIAQRPPDDSLDWLPRNLSWYDRSSAGPLLLAGTLPIICHEAAVTPPALQLLRDCGLSLPDEIIPYRDSAHMCELVAREAHRGRRIGIAYTSRRLLAPAESYVNDPHVHAALNDKANLARLLPPEGAPRRRIVRAVLAALSALVIPVGGLVLLAKLFLGLSTVTASAAAPDGRMVVQLVDPGRLLDRNFIIRLRGSSGWWRQVWASPDEDLPGGERFVWSRDGRHVLLIGPKFFALPESCLASGEFLYLDLDTKTGVVRNNATQSKGPRFTLADLTGLEFTARLDAGGRTVGSPWGSTRCEAASPAR